MQPEEVWRKVTGYRLYSVSNLGRIRNDKTGRILSTPTIRGNCGRGNPYCIVGLRANKKRKHMYVHRLVAREFCKIPKGCSYQDRKWVVNHLNNNGLDNRANNLEWTTARQNNMHCPHCYERSRTLQHAYEDSYRAG